MVKPTSFFGDFTASEPAISVPDASVSMRQNLETESSPQFQKTLTDLAQNNAAITEFACPQGLSQTELLALAKAVGTNISLISLDMGDNTLDAKAGKAFHRAIKRNNSLMSFSAAPVEGDEQAAMWIDKIENEVQKNNAQEFPPKISKKLRLKRDANLERKEQEDIESLRPHTIQSAITTLSENTYPAAHLTCPEGMTQKQLQSLGKSLAQNKSLTSLDVGHNVMNIETLEIMRDAMATNKNLIDISWGEESVTQSDDVEALRTEISSLAERNAAEAENYAQALLNIRSLFQSSDSKITDDFDAINERTSAVANAFHKIKPSNSIAKEPQELFESANLWGSARYIQTRLDIPHPLVAPLEGLTVEPALRAVPTSRLQPETSACTAASLAAEATASRTRQ